MAINQTGDRDLWAAITRPIRKGWFGADVSITERAPLALSNEAIASLNAAGTGYVDLIKADAADTVQMAGGRMVANSVAKTISDGAATALFDVACPSGSRCGGSLFYTVEVFDGTDHQALTGMVTYSAVNKAATLTLTITEVAGNQAKAVSAGTLTLAWTFVTGTGKGTVKLQPTGSLTETLFTVTYTVFPNVGAITIL
jgi:hypothetical protein